MAVASTIPRRIGRIAIPEPPKPVRNLAQGDAEMIAVPMRRKDRASGISDPINLSITADVERVQAALRTAERGDWWMLSTYYRDMILGFGHLQSEWFKRKSVIIGQPYQLIPARQNNADDEFAVRVISQMIDTCENWIDGCMHLLDATLYPVAVCEKIFDWPRSDDDLEIPVRYVFRKFAEINPVSICLQLPYTFSASPQMQRTLNGYGPINEATVYDVDDWEADLRFYSTNPNGTVNRSISEIYAPDPMRHICHRGDMLSRSIRDNFGGQMRAILFWWLLATKGRDWWGLFAEKYGSPFILGKADAQQKDTVAFLQQAFAMATKIGGLVIDKRAEAELVQAATADAANAHKSLIQFCNDEVSKIVVGQVLSSTPKNTGLGSGVADLHGKVREDIALYDKRKLDETLGNQLFEPYLRMNGIRGRAPHILWGGEKETDAKMLADSVASFKQAELEPDDEGLETLSHRIGYTLRRAPKPIVKPANGNPVNQ